MCSTESIRSGCQEAAARAAAPLTAALDRLFVSGAEKGAYVTPVLASQPRGRRTTMPAAAPPRCSSVQDSGFRASGQYEETEGVLPFRVYLVRLSGNPVLYYSIITNGNLCGRLRQHNRRVVVLTTNVRVCLCICSGTSLCTNKRSLSLRKTLKEECLYKPLVIWINPNSFWNL